MSLKQSDTSPKKWQYQNKVNGKTYGAYWNGKAYGSKYYISTDEGKIEFNSETGRVQAQGSNTVGSANDALAYISSKGIEPFSRFDFESNRSSLTAPKK